MVFEIEREIGSFYRGWDEDALDDDLQLPPAFDDDEIDDDEAENRATNALGYPSSAPLTASPAAAEFPRDQQAQNGTSRDRHNSMPSSSTRGSPVATSFPPRQMPVARPRRNSSIHEPSPLARLFIKSGVDSDVIDKLRQRRQSLVGLAMPSSQSQPSLASALSPLSPKNRGRAHSRNMSQPPQMFQPLQSSNLARTSPLPQPSPILEDDSARQSTLKAPKMPPLEEGTKKLAFASPNLTPTPSRPQSPAPSRSRHGGVPFPGRDASTSAASMSASGTIGKASEVEARQSDMGTTGRAEEERNWRERLESMEERQMRIESMLKRLVGDE